MWQNDKVAAGSGCCATAACQLEGPDGCKVGGRCCGSEATLGYSVYSMFVQYLWHGGLHADPPRPSWGRYLGFHLAMCLVYFFGCVVVGVADGLKGAMGKVSGAFSDMWLRMQLDLLCHSRSTSGAMSALWVTMSGVGGTHVLHASVEKPGLLACQAAQSIPFCDVSKLRPVCGMLQYAAVVCHKVLQCTARLYREWALFHSSWLNQARQCWSMYRLRSEVYWVDQAFCYYCFAIAVEQARVVPDIIITACTYVLRLL